MCRFLWFLLSSVISHVYSAPSRSPYQSLLNAKAQIHQAVGTAPGTVDFYDDTSKSQALQSPLNCRFDRPEPHKLVIYDEDCPEGMNCHLLFQNENDYFEFDTRYVKEEVSSTPFDSEVLNSGWSNKVSSSFGEEDRSPGVFYTKLSVCVSDTGECGHVNIYLHAGQPDIRLDQGPDSVTPNPNSSWRPQIVSLCRGTDAFRGNHDSFGDLRKRVRGEAPLTFSDPTVHDMPKLREIPSPSSISEGHFSEQGRSGVPAMHAALMPNGNVVFIDKMETYTELRLPSGPFAYSSMYNPESKELSPLSYQTNAFCSAGAFLANGTLLNVGGSASINFNPAIGGGYDAIRYLTTKTHGPQHGWAEPGNKLDTSRWYPSAQILTDGSIFVASGSTTGIDQNDFSTNNPTYEVLNREGVSNGKSIPMEILQVNQPRFLYPFLHLLSSGELFVFTSKHSQVFNVTENRIVRQLPDMPGFFRTYPNTGGSVLLPLRSSNSYQSEIMICGGGESVALRSPTDPSCGRIQPEAEVPQWQMSSMPEGRTMVEGVLLPDGNILWINGANEGSQGWGIARYPTFEALIYNPQKDEFKIAGKSQIARLYHSVALLLLDGTVLIAGSNPSWDMIPYEAVNPVDPAMAFPTEFRVEIYTPPYLLGENLQRRPREIQLSTSSLSVDGSTFDISFRTPKDARDCNVVLYHGGFVTHSLHMGQRMIYLDFVGFEQGASSQKLVVQMPSAAFGNSVAPPGPYVVYVVVDGIPGIGQSVMVT